MNDKPNIYQRINAVMAIVKYAQKDKAVSGGGQNYKAVTHDQVVSELRAAIVENGIVVEPVQTKGEIVIHRDMNAKPEPVKMMLYSGEYDVFFVNMDDPKDRTCVKVQAHASDNGDKAPGKCFTYAVKMALLKQFTLETGENDESRAEARNPDLISQHDADLLYPHLIDSSSASPQWTQKGALLSQQYQFAGPDQIRAKDLSKVKKALGL